jgi:hypothetical protein
MTSTPLPMRPLDGFTEAQCVRLGTLREQYAATLGDTLGGLSQADLNRLAFLRYLMLRGIVTDGRPA